MKPKQELQWDWNSIDTDTLTFPKDFQFCVATSEYQLSGSGCFHPDQNRCPVSNWSRYEQQKTWRGTPVIESSGIGIDHWRRYKEDIQLIKELGVAVYRCSLDWARLQPQENLYDEEALQHYHDLFDELARQNIRPLVTLLHFVHPGWFEDKGAFEREENIAYFISFAQHMFQEYGNKVSSWCTINEPSIYAAQTYFTHDFPRPIATDLGFPCSLRKGFCLYGAALVTKHLMMAHVAVYKALKALQGGAEAHIGIAHNIIQFEPFHPGNYFEEAVTQRLSRLYSDAVTQFLITGELALGTYTGWVRWTYPGIRDVQDFVGLNYYSHVLFSWTYPFKPQMRPHEVATDMYYSIYAEGLYRAIKEISAVGKPIYITENGLADARDDRRELWYRRYLYAVVKALREGADVRMFCAWSAFDNFEWNLGYRMKFGLYGVDSKTYERRLKESTLFFKEVVERHNKK